MDNYHLILNNMSILIKTHKSVILRKQKKFVCGSSQLGFIQTISMFVIQHKKLNRIYIIYI